MSHKNHELVWVWVSLKRPGNAKSTRTSVSLDALLFALLSKALDGPQPARSWVRAQAVLANAQFGVTARPGSKRGTWIGTLGIGLSRHIQKQAILRIANPQLLTPQSEAIRRAQAPIKDLPNASC
jgi:hypothetical protein